MRWILHTFKQKQNHFYVFTRHFWWYPHNASMHLIIDIRSPSPVDSVITRYARNWVNLWKERHPGDSITYIHFEHQDCPDNGKSVIVKSAWHHKKKSIAPYHGGDIFRCVSFSPYRQYDPKIMTIWHIFHHVHALYPKNEPTWIQSLFKKFVQDTISKYCTIIVPSLNIWQETVDILHVPEDSIEIIPYYSITKEESSRAILNQLSISGPYWLYDGTYGSEANIYGLLKGYKWYKELGGDHILILVWQPTDIELYRISELIQKMDLTGSVRMTWSLDESSIEWLYTYASGWIYIGAYYAGGPRIELARTHKLPLIVSDIPVFSDYKYGAITLHPNHLSWLSQSMRDLENIIKKERRKISNDIIMKAYEKIIAEKR